MRGRALVLSLGAATGCIEEPRGPPPWWTGLPWKASDAAFRAREGRAPVPRGRGFVLDDSYKDAAMVEELLRGYHDRHPRLTKLVEIGRTHRDRPMWALKISDRAELDEDEPAMLLDGAHHGGELISIEYVLDAIDVLVAGYEVDPRVTTWVDGLEIWCVPLVNPDANHRFVHETDRDGRKNARGVDLNRNYPFAWADLEHSYATTSPYYRGPEPGSEPETQAMMQLGDREHFAAALSFHTLGTDLYGAYVVETRRDPSPDVVAAIGRELADAAPLQPDDRPYDLRPTPRPVAGCAPDWHMHEYGAVAYVVEGSHHNPEPDIRRRSIEGTRPLWMRLFDRVLDGPWIGGHVRDAAGNPVVAEVMVKEIETFEGESWTTRARDGRFDRAVLGPGHYTLLVRPPNGAPLEREVDVEGRTDVEIVVP